MNPLSKLSPGQNVAVIGSGISGLASAWFLSQSHNVTVFEKNAKLGGHTNTVRVDVDGKNLPVDTGFIVFNRPNYPNLTAMLAHLNVDTIETEMSFSASIDNGALEYSGNNLNTLFAQRRNLLSLAHWKMIRQILRFNKQAKSDLKTRDNLEMSLGDYLKMHGFDERMQSAYLLPMAAAIWSCPVTTMMKFPVGSFLQFFENHGLLNVEDRPQWETIKGGSQTYINAMLEQAEFDFYLESPVTSVEQSQAGNVVILANGEKQVFDHVVFASHADQSYAMLSPELQNHFSMMKDFQYQENIAYLHTDLKLMPKRKLAWASWNYLRDTKHEENRVAVTYWMNLLQTIDTPTPLLVTLNPLELPDQDKTFQKIVYEHPVFDKPAMDAQQTIKSLQGDHNVWFCGAYLGYGFHEDGLTSAVNLARLWNVALPWEQATGTTQSDQQNYA
ncbi:MAG: FAD-dependent oxidoreductase [Thiotrichales bacterium]|nr:FAD-dependent oxidoreductase [Thiotrichales bacterium]